MKRIALVVLAAATLSSCQGRNEPSGAPPVKPQAKPVVVRPDPTAGMDPASVALYEATAKYYEDVVLGQVNDLTAGTEHVIEGTQDTLEFLKIQKDTRCPEEVKCIWAGEVVVILKGTVNGKVEYFSLGHRAAKWRGYQMSIKDVLPHPGTKVPAQMPHILVQVDKVGAPIVSYEIPGTTQPIEVAQAPSGASTGGTDATPTTQPNLSDPASHR